MSRTTVLGTLLLGLALAAQQEQGNRLYRRGETEEAVARYRRAAERNPREPAIEYSLGTALLSAGRARDAQRHLVAARSAPDPELRVRALYNLGNAELAPGAGSEPGAVRRAVDAYRHALLIRPDDFDAKWNLEVALRRLERAASQSPEPRPQGGVDEQEAPSGAGGAGPPRPAPAPDPAGSRPLELRPLSREAAEQILNAVEEQERALQKEMLRRARPAQRPAGPDW